MSEPIAHSRPTVGEAEAEAARRVLLSGQLAQGREVEALEAELCELTGRRCGVAVSSGTTALALALAALGLPPGSAVLAPSYVCAALLHAIGAAGGRPRLADIDPATRNLDPQEAGRRRDGCAAAVVPHMFGLPAAVETLVGVERPPVIEDCAMCLGTARAGRPVGGRGQAAVCSFYATKVVTTAGEGGMVLTDDEGLAAEVRARRQYDGRRADRQRYNAKMTEVAAAVGRVQVSRLAGFVARRREIAARYAEALAPLGLELPPADPAHTYYRYVVAVPGGAAPWIDRLEAAGVAARRPIATPLHRELGLPDAQFPASAAAWSRDLSLPIYPALADAAVARVIAAVRTAAGD